MNPILRAAALAAVSLPLLSGCQTAAQRAMCPSINILANTSALTQFKPNMQGDPAGEMFELQMTGAKASCNFDVDEGTTDTNIDITFRATRAPSGEAANFTAPYYLASVQDGTTILSKKILATAFTFAPGEASVTFSENVPSTVMHLENGVKPYQYGFLVGLQLTKEQLDYIKNHGRFAP